MSTRLRRSISSSRSHVDTSPEKKPITLRRGSKGKAQSPVKRWDGDSNTTPSRANTGEELTLVEDDQTSSNGSEAAEEEGEEELMEGRASNETVDAEEGEPELESLDTDYIPTRKRTASPTKSKGGEPSKQVIRLVFGKKRKADDEASEKDEADEPEDVSEHTEPVMSPQKAAEQSTEDHTSEASKNQAGSESVNEVANRRVPRKKRKWLKKGEVDPDDPVAVARQQERHRLIDEAIESLNAQEKTLLSGSHPQLVWLWEELERRKDMQLKFLSARQDAVISDLQNLRDHEKKVAVSDFLVKRDDLSRQVSLEGRHRMERIVAERIALKRTPDSTANLRSGRGGGGWPVHVNDLLSNGERRITTMEVKGETRTRRDVSRQLLAIDRSEAKADLDKIGFRRRGKTSTRSRSPITAPSSSAAYPQPRHNRPEERKPLDHSQTHRQDLPPHSSQPRPAHLPANHLHPPPHRDRPLHDVKPIGSSVPRPPSPEVVHVGTKRAEAKPPFPRWDMLLPPLGSPSPYAHDLDVKQRKRGMNLPASMSMMNPSPTYGYMPQYRPPGTTALPQGPGLVEYYRNATPLVQVRNPSLPPVYGGPPRP